MKILDRALPHAATGLLLAVALREASAFGGAGATPTLCALALVAACSRGARPASPSRVGVVAAALVTSQWGALTAWVARSTDPVTATVLVTAPVAFLGARACATPSRGRPLPALVGLAVGTMLPSVLVIAALAFAALRPRTAHERPRDRHAGIPAHLVALTATVVAAVTWALVAPWFDPTPLAALAALAGLYAAGTAAGFATDPDRAATRMLRGALALALLGGAAAWAGLRADTLDAPLRGAAWITLAGAGLGLLGSATLPRAPAPARTSVIGLLVAAWIVPHVASLLPVSVRAALAGTTVGAGVQRAALTTRRGEADIASTSLGPARSIVWRGRGTDALAFAEVDGGPREPGSRAARGDRFAATLAGCAAAERGVVRLSGDALAEALPALLLQGFRDVDVAAPDRDLLAAVGALDRRAWRAWLRPGVRLLDLPDPVVAHAGRPADAVVELLRHPWTSGRGTLPSPTGLRATRASLREGGVHVLALPAARMDHGMLAWTTRAFAEAYPASSAWLSPDGVDTLVLVGFATRGARIPWSGVRRCVEADRAALATSGVGDAEDLASLAVLDGTGMGVLDSPRAPGAGMPASAWQPAQVTLPPLPETDPGGIFDSQAPVDALRARAVTRRAWLEVLARTRGGDPRALFAEAARLRSLPGGEAALAPLVAPHLARARAAMARAAREGLGATAWSEAEAALATARLLTPDGAEARCVEGDLAAARGQLARAEEAYAACVKADAGALAGWDGLARVRRQKGDATGMEQALRGAQAARPERWTTAQNLGVYCLETGRLDEAEPLLRQAAALANRETPAPAEPTLALARLHLASDRPALALAETERALALAPRRADALAARGAARYDLGQIALAEEDFRAALDADPRDLTARGGLGQVHASRGEYDLAAAAFRTVLERDPRNAAARENLRRLGPLLQERRLPGGGRSGARDLDTP